MSTQKCVRYNTDKLNTISAPSRLQSQKQKDTEGRPNIGERHYKGMGQCYKAMIK